MKETIGTDETTVLLDIYSTYATSSKYPTIQEVLIGTMPNPKDEGTQEHLANLLKQLVELDLVVIKENASGPGHRITLPKGVSALIGAMMLNQSYMEISARVERLIDPVDAPRAVADTAKSLDRSVKSLDPSAQKSRGDGNRREQRVSAPSAETRIRDTALKAGAFAKSRRWLPWQRNPSDE